jgi:hypothetical protein
MIRPFIALGIVTGCTAAVALYPTLRLIQFFFGFEPNPATIIISAHSGYLWRASITAYGGGMAALLGGWLARRDPPRIARALAVALPAAAALLALQALFVP